MRLAQGNALGRDLVGYMRPERAKALINRVLLPLLGVVSLNKYLPKTTPWAMCLQPFQGTSPFAN
jgi:hypothetical protein